MCGPRDNRKSAPSQAPTCTSASGTVLTSRAGCGASPALDMRGGHRACGIVEGQLTDRAQVHWAQGLPGHWRRVRVVQLEPWGASKVRGMQFR